MTVQRAYYASMETPVGRLLVAGEEDVLHRVGWTEEAARFPARLRSMGIDAEEDPTKLRPALEAFDAYFAEGAPLNGLQARPLEGTPFQQEVWRALETIPHGEVRSYRWLAEAIDQPTAFRAVAAANGANPLPILVPCHRVISSDGHLGGYSGGPSVKERLLELEGLEVDGRGYVSSRSTSSP